MEWLQENWFWLFVFVMFIWMHMGGHGHGGHGGHSRSRASEPRNAGEEGIGPDDHGHPDGGHHAHGARVHSHLQPVQETVGGGVTRGGVTGVATRRVEKTSAEARPSTTT